MANEVLGWCSVLASVALGLYMGLAFQREDWLGGYAAFPRRMVRLAHISLAALGILNVQFAQSLPRLRLEPQLAGAASVSLMAAAVLMPACCLWLAFRRSHYEIFAAPIACLAAGLLLTIGGLLR